MQEQRQYIRLSKSLVVGYKIKGQFLSSGGRSKNISAGGICLPIFQMLNLGTILDLEVHLKEFEKPIKVTGEIIWITKREDVRLPFEAGIKFIKIDPSERNKIFYYISHDDQADIKWIE